MSQKYITRSQRETINVWYALLVVGVIIALFVNTIATDEAGLNDNDHREAMPTGVVELTGNSYLITNSDIDHNDICKGDSADTDDGQTIEATARIEQLQDTTYLQCDKEQIWSVNKKESPNFGEAMLSTLGNAWFIGSSALGFLIMSIYPVALLLSNGRHNRRVDKAEKAAAEKEERDKYDALEARYRAIQSAYARDEIDDLQFDNKVKALVDDGYQLPDKDIFKA
jgi:hypothetical protein